MAAIYLVSVMHAYENQRDGSGSGGGEVLNGNHIHSLHFPQCLSSFFEDLLNSLLTNW